ncbi:hypothetical protein chiPu_0028071, partial [Chiloscyllium punctatum]|nr:hypothetical protein [Chiloscyllium punctatum]
PARPVAFDGGFDADARRAAQDSCAIVARLLAEQVEARSRDDRGLHSPFRQQPCGFERDRHLRTRCNQGDVTREGRLDQNVGAERDLVVPTAVADRRQRLPRQAEDRRRGLRLQRAVPGFRGLNRVGRTKHQHIRDRAQRGEMLDRLMRRPVLAEPDRVMGHHMDDADPHQRREADRRPAVIGEAQEGAAIGNEATMQRDAVHRRRHAVLADAIVDVAAVEHILPHRNLRLRLRQVGVCEVSRAAEQVRQGLRDHIDDLLRGLPRREFRPLGRKALDERGHRLGIGAGQFPVQRVVERRPFTLAGGTRTFDPGAPRVAATAAELAPLGQHGIGNLEGQIRPAQRAAGLRRLVGAERR